MPPEQALLRTRCRQRAVCRRDNLSPAALRDCPGYRRPYSAICGQCEPRTLALSDSLCLTRRMSLVRHDDQHVHRTVATSERISVPVLFRVDDAACSFWITSLEACESLLLPDSGRDGVCNHFLQPVLCDVSEACRGLVGAP